MRFSSGFVGAAAPAPLNGLKNPPNGEPGNCKQSASLRHITLQKPSGGLGEQLPMAPEPAYCPCGVTGDNCTGDFYTLASCNPNGCGMPNVMRKAVAEKIDKGLTDKQIFEELLKEQGPELVRQHLKP